MLKINSSAAGIQALPLGEHIYSISDAAGQDAQNCRHCGDLPHVSLLFDPQTGQTMLFVKRIR